MSVYGQLHVAMATGKHAAILAAGLLKPSSKWWPCASKKKIFLVVSAGGDLV